MAEQLSATPSTQWWQVTDGFEPETRGIAKRFLGSDERLRCYFERQAIIASMVRRASLVPLLAADLDSPQPVLLWPWVTGKRLDQWLQNRTELPPKPVLLWIARQILQGLDGLHTSGFVHGNVRPENILIAADYSIHLLGLGRCELVGEVLPMVHRPTPYDPPEITQANFESSSARDIYSAARVIADMLGSEFGSTEIGRQMLAALPEARPTAGQLTQQLLHLEHQLLGNCLRAA